MRRNLEFSYTGEDPHFLPWTTSNSDFSRLIDFQIGVSARSMASCSRRSDVLTVYELLQIHQHLFPRTQFARYKLSDRLRGSFEVDVPL
ncbi:hypothetical protein PsorP6_001329 [Peronosclerospora sorghi]|uniref:Uncharacterized protein n=1 Tax=Peronosclerospora sorghi TaxID=230839 RepID=A0ACC0WSW1_9STRA|nr:hypothetical protein PsorP6_001329 [Peronosclerospora sorghi]